MVQVAFIDHVETLECETRFGVIHHLKRLVRVVGLTNTDYQVLTSGLAVAGVPADGSTLSGGGGAFENLVLTQRAVKLVQADPRVVDVELTYDHIKNEGQNLNAPPLGAILGSSQASIGQASSNLDVDGNEITVSYTYPSDDADWPDQLKSQGGEIQFSQAQNTRKYQGLKFTFYPWLVEASIVGCTNAVSWAGGAVGSWLCNACSWEPWDVAGGRYLFTFEFQFNPDGWDPTVVFQDPRTNKPPLDLIQGTGYLTVRKYHQVNFEGIIGNRVQGG